MEPPSDEDTEMESEESFSMELVENSQISNVLTSQVPFLFSCCFSTSGRTEMVPQV